jgi:hypothetical protein
MQTHVCMCAFQLYNFLTTPSLKSLTFSQQSGCQAYIHQQPHIPPPTTLLTFSKHMTFHLWCCGPLVLLPPKTLPWTPACSISCSWLWLIPFDETLFVFSSPTLSRTSPSRVIHPDPWSSWELLLPTAQPTEWPAATVGGDGVVPSRGGEKHRGKYSSLSHANREFLKCSSRAARPWHVRRTSNQQNRSS